MQNLPVLRALAANWGAIALRGVLAILFGILAWLWPGMTLAVLIILYAVYALVDGVMGIVVGIRGRNWGYALLGLVGVIAGLVAVAWPLLTALVLVTIIGVWAIVIGVMEIVTAIRLRNEIEGEWLLALTGALWVLFGAYALAFPGAGALSLVWLIGTWAVVIGVLEVILAFRLRRLAHHHGGTHATA